MLEWIIQSQRHRLHFCMRAPRSPDEATCFGLLDAVQADLHRSECLTLLGRFARLPHLLRIECLTLTTVVA